MTSFLKKELCAVRHGSFNVKGDNMIGERQIVHHKMTQEQIANELCGVGKGNNQWTRQNVVSTQEQMAKELGVFIMAIILARRVAKFAFLKKILQSSWEFHLDI